MTTQFDVYYYANNEGKAPIVTISLAIDPSMPNPLELPLELEPENTPSLNVPLEQWAGSPRRG